MIPWSRLLFLAACVRLAAFGQDASQVELQRKSEMARFAAVSRASATPSDPTIDVRYYRLNLTIRTSPPGLSGIVTVAASAAAPSLSFLSLDLADTMTVDSVFAGGQLCPFVHQGGTITVTLDRAYTTGELITVDLFYGGLPVETGFGSFVFSSHGGVPWVWSLSEPYGARDWWPCKDHPLDKADSADIWITCDSTFKVGSNGRLVSVTDNGDGTRTWKWAERYPIAAYLISIALTNYVEFSNWFRYSPSDSMQVLNYVIPEHLADGLAQLPRTVEMLGVFSDRFGLYPFITEKYGHAEFGRGGAMEHQTMTSATLPGFSESVVAHELAHQWFGDLITCANWPNLWLNEGFATYAEAIYYEDRYGAAAYWNDILPKLARAKTAAGTLFVQDTAPPPALFNHPLVYDKGASVLHMLRHVLGDSLFFLSLKSYAADPALRFSTAVTEDFQASCETVSGRDLTWFFQEWVYGERYPRYQYSWTAAPSGGRVLATVTIDQSTGTTNPSFFTMPVDLRCSAPGWDTTVTILHTFSGQQVVMDLPVLPATIDLDPEGWILADVTPATGVNPQPPPLPAGGALLQNYPNPFNGKTEIGFRIREGGGGERVTMRVVDMLGREVATLLDAAKPPGDYAVSFDGDRLPSGVYLCEFRLGALRETRKLLLLR